MPNEQPGFSLGTVFRILATGAFYYLATRTAWVLTFPDSKVSLSFLRTRSSFASCCSSRRGTGGLMRSPRLPVTSSPRSDTPGPCMARKPSRGCREHRRVSAPCDQVAPRCSQLCLGISDDDSPIGGRDCPFGPALRITSHRRPSPALALDSVLSCSSLARYASRGSVQVGREHAKRRG